MPNNTRNLFFMTGSPEQIHEFLSEVCIKTDSGYEFDFGKHIPPPDTDAYRDLPTQREASNHPDWWYTRNNANWGTKWNAYEEQLFISKPFKKYETSSPSSLMVFYFESAWNIPEPVINKIMPILDKYEAKYLASCEGGWFEVVYSDGDLEKETPSTTASFWLLGIIESLIISHQS